MEEPQKVGDLEIHQDLEFETRNWRVQRLGWALMGLMVLAGLAGLFGRGPLSHAEATSGGGALTVKYERFVRHAAPSEVEFVVQPSAIEGGVVRLLVSRAFLQGLQVEGVEPPPETAALSGDYLLYAFPAGPSGREARILFRIVPDHYLLRRAEVTLPDGRERVWFRQFVFP